VQRLEVDHTDDGQMNEPPDDNMHHQVQIEQADTGKLLFLGVHETRIAHMDLGKSETIDATTLAIEHPAPNIWEHSRSISPEPIEIPTIYGATVAGLQSFGLTFVTTPEGRPLAPGFQSIESIGNEGMIATLQGNTYLVIAANEAAAVKNHLELAVESGLVGYPMFLMTPELAITRFDPEEARKGGWKTLAQIQGKDPFGLEKDKADPRDMRTRENFAMVMESVRSYETSHPYLITHAYAEGATHEYFEPIDDDSISAQMVVSRYDDGATVISMQGKLDAHTERQGGFFLVQRSDGRVLITDMGHTEITDAECFDWPEKFASVLDYVTRYNSGLLKIIYNNRPTVIPKPSKRSLRQDIRAYLDAPL
jgi:hypothetical protein